MKFQTNIDGKVLIVRATRSGRLGLAMARVWSILPWSAGIAAFFFAIEWGGNTLVGTAQPSWVYLFLGVFLGVAVAFMFGLSRFLRDDLWAFDVGEQVLAWESRMPWGQLRSVQVPLSDLVRIENVSTEGQIVMVFASGDRETLCELREASLRDEVYEKLRKHLGKSVEWL